MYGGKKGQQEVENSEGTKYLLLKWRNNFIREISKIAGQYKFGDGEF